MILIRRTPFNQLITCGCPMCRCEMQISLSSTQPSKSNPGVRYMACPECHHSLYFNMSDFAPPAPQVPTPPADPETKPDLKIVPDPTVGPEPAQPSQPQG